MECRALFVECRSLFVECKAISVECRASQPYVPSTVLRVCTDVFVCV